MLEVPAEREEDVAALLAGETLGARVGASREGRTRIEVVLGSPAEAARACAEAARLLRRAGLDPQACRLREIEIADERWVEAYQAGLEPFRLGSRFVVQPGRREAASGGLDRIVLAPGRAFGTGEHPTTQLCACALERAVEPGSRWLDLGCGTAILSVVAHRCGAARVLALDHDASAVRVGRGVVRDNGAAKVVTVRRGSLEQAGTTSWDGVVCNISAGFLERHAATLAGSVRPGGWLVAAGFLSGDLPGTRESLTAAGLHEWSRTEEASWAVLTMRRP